jgi:SAM-dependent methyltransferase
MPGVAPLQQMDLSDYRESDGERLRTESLLRLLPMRGTRLLDIGAREGHFSKLLADRFDEVVALDLEAPQIQHDRVRCVAGDATALQFDDGSFDAVLCAEVLEHIPSPGLERACREISRVTSGVAVVGVPFRQDTRVGRTTCSRCGKPNPPWGHVNEFDEPRLRHLFDRLNWDSADFVGDNRWATNALSCALLDWAGNPYGTYEQLEPCIYCSHPLGQPRHRGLGRKIATRVATELTRIQERLLVAPHPNWIHVRLRR